LSFTITSPATTSSSADALADAGEVGAGPAASGCTGTSEHATTASADAAARAVASRPVREVRDIDGFLLRYGNAPTRTRGSETARGSHPTVDARTARIGCGDELH
jgi:hypothetical protein